MKKIKPVNRRIEKIETKFKNNPAKPNINRKSKKAIRKRTMNMQNQAQWKSSS